MNNAEGLIAAAERANRFAAALTKIARTGVDMRSDFSRSAKQSDVARAALQEPSLMMDRRVEELEVRIKALEAMLRKLVVTSTAFQNAVEDVRTEFDPDAFMEWDDAIDAASSLLAEEAERGLARG